MGRRGRCGFASVNDSPSIFTFREKVEKYIFAVGNYRDTEFVIVAYATELLLGWHCCLLLASKVGCV